MARKSLWAEYREGLSDVEFHEFEWGFVSVRPLSDIPHALLVEDAFVLPEFRGQDKAWELMHAAEAAGRKAGKTHLVSSVSVTYKNCAASLAANLAVGFEPTGLNGDRIWLSKLIPEETV